jgi:hypothetical protein
MIRFKAFDFLTAALLVGVVGPNLALSEGKETECSSCPVAVDVRVVRASNPSPSELSLTSQQAARKPRIDFRLKDLAAKLQRLPFQSYTVVSVEHRLIPLKKREVIGLSGGQTLTLRPLYVEDKRVGMWLKWQDQNGGDILDTRMHFDFGESVLTGTDNSENGGLILAIDVTQP